MSERTLTLVLAGDARQMSRTLKRASGDVGAFGRAAGPGLQRAMKTGAAAAVALGAALGQKAVAGALKLGRGLAEVRTLLPDLTDDGFGRLRDSVIDLSTEMGIATDQAVPALYQAISAGVGADSVFDFLGTASKASIGGVTDLATAVDALTTVTNTWGRSAGVTATQAADVLFTSVKLGKTTFGELGASINQVAGLSASFGIEFEGVAAAVVEVTKAGVPTAEAMTKIRALIQSIAAPTARTAKQFEALGIQTGAARLANEGLLPVLTEIMAATAGNEAQQRKLFGSVEALQAAVVLASGGGAAYAATLDEMRDSAGAADAAFETMADTTGHRLTVAMNELDVRLTELGTSALPLVNDGLAVLVAALDAADAAASAAGAGFAAVEAAWAATVTQFVAGADDAEQAGGWVRRYEAEAADAAQTTAAAFAFSSGEINESMRASMLTAGMTSETFETMLADAQDAAADAAAATARVREGVAAAARQWQSLAGLHAGIQRQWAQRQAAAADAHMAHMEQVYRGVSTLGADIERAQRAQQQRSYAALSAHLGLAAKLRRFDAMRHRSQTAETWRVVEDTAAAATTRVLTESERLAAGMLVTMTDACGAVTGFRQCAYGMVVEFDRDMNIVLSEAQSMAAGLQTPIRNACGTVTGFRQCVDGMVVEFDAAGNRVLTDAQRLASGVAVEMVNACGTVTGFRQCVDGMVVEFDAAGDQVLTDAQRLAAGVAVEMRNACGTVVELRQCIDGELVTTDLRPGAAAAAASAAVTASAAVDEGIGRLVGHYTNPAGDVVYNYLTSGGVQTDVVDGVTVPVPALAAGGIVTAPTLALLGESGPEAVIPLTGGRAAAGVHVHVSLHVDGGVVSEGDLAEYIVEAVNEGLRRGDVSAAAAFA